jgi:hypothetical protein
MHEIRYTLGALALVVMSLVAVLMVFCFIVVKEVPILASIGRWVTRTVAAKMGSTLCIFSIVDKVEYRSLQAIMLSLALLTLATALVNLVAVLYLSTIVAGVGSVCAMRLEEKEDRLEEVRSSKVKTSTEP